MKRLTVKEAAAELRVSLSTIYALCQQRQLRHERHGPHRGTIRIPEDAIDEYRQTVTVSVGREAVKPPPAHAAATAGQFEMLDGERLRAAWRGREP
jgi:excisionase family DNA binding protein